MNTEQYSNDDSTQDSGSCCASASCCAPQAPIKRDQPKVGRNSPCPCGNGKKFKKCCGRQA
ncbi:MULTISPECIES: SEC-C metal-binding domain-containing protein [Gilvimarinus]|uniref:SEC-C metal-binding domain-containing protein n=1 Tax=Gilvimarinus TaxID=940550 RepID=UPI0009FC52A2|nr:MULTISPECIES: SEC-C metal-binding domain-containing protein [Gilvimarinus]